MSDHATAARPLAQRRALRTAHAASQDRGKDWPLASVFFTSVLAVYGLVVGSFYVLVTSINWQLLAAASLIVVLVNLLVIVVLLLRSLDLERMSRIRRRIGRQP